MPYCLPPSEAKKIMDAIVSGRLNPEKLNNMTSANRRKFLADLVGEGNAKQVNLLFERKLLLKNQERAMSDWAREITGMSKEAKEATLNKIRQTYADKKRRLYEPKENEVFLNEIISDVYSKKTGTDISLQEAQTITELGADMAKNQARVEDSYTWEKGVKFGASKVAFDNYVGDLKSEAQKRPLVNPFTQKGWNKLAAVIENAKISANFIFDNARTIKASYDNSFWGRQGIKVMWNPRFTDLWAKNFGKSFNDIYKTLKGDIGRGMSVKDVVLGRDAIRAGDAVLDATKANVYAEKNYLNGRYTTAGKKGSKLDLGGTEEEILTSAPTKLPILGRVFKFSETAYTAGAIRLRVDVANRLYEMAEKTGNNLKDPEIVGGINELTNSMTGRGKLKLSESTQKIVNKVFFSIKFFKSNWDVLVAIPKLAADPRNFAKQQAAKNLLSIATTIGMYQMIRMALNPDDVEPDPRSSDWGTTRKGDTRSGITGGLRQIVTLVARITPTMHNGEWGQWVKSSTTGRYTKLGEEYGSSYAIDLIEGFFENKTSPGARQIMELANQKTFAGGKPSIKSVATGLALPIIIEEGISTAKNEQSEALFSVLTKEFLGVSVSTYSINTNWNRRPSKALLRFKKGVGEKKFNQANDEFNKNMRIWFAKEQKTTKYKNFSDEEKSESISREKSMEKRRVLSKYGY